jgi:LCP family protein required for cell wall assembly
VRSGPFGRRSRPGGLQRSGGRRWPKRLLVGTAVFVVVMLLAGLSGYLYLDSKLGGIPRVPVSGLSRPVAGQPLDVLLIGSDSRAFETNGTQAKAFGSKTVQTGQRADTIMIARFLTDGHVEMLSIPRDTWVQISGAGGSNRINAAYNSGPSQLVATIEHDFGIPINHVAMVDFGGFPAMVDALGGISMDFPDPVVDRYTGLDVKQTGCQTVTGNESLALVRSRHLYYYAQHQWNYDGMSDFSRIQRQQAFFHSLLNRIHSVVPDLFRLNSFVGATVQGLKLDQGFSSNALLALGWSYHSLGQDALTNSILPTSNAVISGADVLLPAPGPDHQVIQAFLAGDTKTFTSASGAPAAHAVLTSGGVISGHLAEPWNPFPC